MARPNSQPHRGPPRTIESGTASNAPASARARNEGGAHCEINQVYVVALNGATNSALNSTIGVGGNTVSAAAYGNTATNTLTLAAVNTGMPTAGIGSWQSNTAGVTASVTTVTYGIGPASGAITGSSLGVTGNAITATAVGNNAINTLGAN